MYVIFYTLIRGEEKGGTGNQFSRVAFVCNNISTPQFKTATTQNITNPSYVHHLMTISVQERNKF